MRFSGVMRLSDQGRPSAGEGIKGTQQRRQCPLDQGVDRPNHAAVIVVVRLGHAAIVVDIGPQGDGALQHAVRQLEIKRVVQHPPVGLCPDARERRRTDGCTGVEWEDGGQARAVSGVAIHVEPGRHVRHAGAGPGAVTK